MYAVIQTGGKQYKVEKDTVLYIEKLDAQPEETVTFNDVLVLNTGKTFKVGVPFVKGASVSAKVLKNGKSKKITVMTYKPKKNEKRKMGHRQQYTKVQITDIRASAPRAKAAAAEETAE